MTWVRLDDGFAEHAKIQGLTDRAFRLHVAALCYCGRNLTDGVLTPLALKPLLAASRATRRHVDELVTNGLWDVIDGKHRIHDFLDLNPSAATVKLERDRARERQRRHREARNAVTDAVSHAVSHGVSHAAPVPVPSPTRLKAVPANEIEVEIEKLWGHIRGADDGTWGVLVALARKLPLSSVAKVRESCQLKGKVGAGYAVNALKAELADLEESA